MTMTREAFYQQHKVLFHELLDVMFVADRKVMDWFKARSDDEIIVISFFAAMLADTTGLLGMTLLLEVNARKLDLDKIRAPEALAPS